MNRNVAIYLSADQDNKKRTGVHPVFSALSARGIGSEYYSVNTKNILFGMIYVVFLVTIRRPRIIVATEYYCAFMACVAAMLFYKTCVVAIGFNQSRRLMKFNFPPADYIVNKIFGHLSLVVVHSRLEAHQFEVAHGIPLSRFAFAHWGYDLPGFARAGEHAKRPLVCMVGRNNRDYATFIQAAEQLGIEGVIVAPGYAGLADRPGNRIRTLVDIPMEQCLSLMHSSSVSVVALKDSSRGAGHITMVSAMHLGKPQIVSATPQIEDYIVDNINGLLVPAGDADALADAIARLLSDRELADRLGNNGRLLAAQFMSHQAFAARINDLLEAVMSGLPFSFVEPAWLEKLDALAKTADS